MSWIGNRYRLNALMIVFVLSGLSPACKQVEDERPGEEKGEAVPADKSGKTGPVRRWAADAVGAEAVAAGAMETKTSASSAEERAKKGVDGESATALAPGTAGQPADDSASGAPAPSDPGHEAGPESAGEAAEVGDEESADAGESGTPAEVMPSDPSSASVEPGGAERMEGSAESDTPILPSDPCDAYQVCCLAVSEALSGVESFPDKAVAAKKKACSLVDEFHGGALVGGLAEQQCSQMLRTLREQLDVYDGMKGFRRPAVCGQVRGQGARSGEYHIDFPADDAKGPKTGPTGTLEIPDLKGTPGGALSAMAAELLGKEPAAGEEDPGKDSTAGACARLNACCAALVAQLATIKDMPALAGAGLADACQQLSMIEQLGKAFGGADSACKKALEILNAQSAAFAALPELQWPAVCR